MKGRLLFLTLWVTIFIFACSTVLKNNRQASVWFVPGVIVNSLHPDCLDNRYGFGGETSRELGIPFT